MRAWAASRLRQAEPSGPSGAVDFIQRSVKSPEGAVECKLLADYPLHAAHGVKVAARPGCLLMWDSRLLHANYPNESACSAPASHEERGRTAGDQ